MDTDHRLRCSERASKFFSYDIRLVRFLTFITADSIAKMEIYGDIGLSSLVLTFWKGWSRKIYWINFLAYFRILVMYRLKSFVECVRRETDC